jgi:hypothetical protein
METTCQRLPRHFRRTAPLWLLGLALCGLAGCEEPQVAKYEAERDKQLPDTTRLSSYELPKGWTRLAKPAELSVATFQVEKNGKIVSITISRLPGRAGGRMANLARWRGMVGLPKAFDEEIDKEIQYLQVDGEKTPYVDYHKPKDADTKDVKYERILGVVAERGPVTWFFKMQGPIDLVGEQKAAFEAFVTSMKFGDTGAKDE